MLDRRASDPLGCLDLYKGVARPFSFDIYDVPLAGNAGYRILYWKTSSSPFCNRSLFIVTRRRKRKMVLNVSSRSIRRRSGSPKGPFCHRNPLLILAGFCISTIYDTRGGLSPVRLFCIIDSTVRSGACTRLKAYILV